MALLVPAVVLGSGGAVLAGCEIAGAREATGGLPRHQYSSLIQNERPGASPQSIYFA
jgi:hypothetical protein